jgi:peptidoglycan-associated lipoprotein
MTEATMTALERSLGLNSWLAPGAVVLGVLLSACGGAASQPKPAAPAGASAARPAQAHASGPERVGGIFISETLAKLCSIHARANAPRFDTDSDAITGDERNVLRQVAGCLTNGPLAGKGLLLTGHADARGEREYNMGLGSRRAAAVAKVLEGFGVEHEALSLTSRGELDATGVDEPGWALDRRVELDVRRGKDAVYDVRLVDGD